MQQASYLYFFIMAASTCLTLSNSFMHAFSMPAGLLLFLVLGLAACSSTDDAQRDFENQAFRPPEGITRTDNGGEVQETDPDDWRVSPMYSGFVEIEQPAYPNPTNGQTISIELLVTGLGSVNGIEVVTLDERNIFRPLYFDERQPIPVGFSLITIDPLLFAPGGSGTISGARGLHRVFVFDRRENLITYGDVRVE